MLKTYCLTFVYWALCILTLTAQAQTMKKSDLLRSEKAQKTLKNIATPESNFEWLELKADKAIDKASFMLQTKVLFDLEEANDFVPIKTNSDNNWTHHRLQQTYKGIPVEGAVYMVHEKEGLVRKANGDVVSDLDVSLIPTLTEQEALSSLLEHIGATKYAWEDPISEAMLQHQLQDETATHYPQGQLVIASPKDDLVAEHYALGYKFEVETIEPFSHMVYIVNAHTGAIIAQTTLLCQNDVVGTCNTHSYGTQNITTTLNGGVYQLKETGRNIETYSAANFINNLPANEIEDADNNWTDVNDKTACEAHWAAEQTYDYFYNEHSLLGYNGWNSKLLIWVNWGSNFTNAYGGGGKIRLGDGDNVNYGPMSSLDIVAHEYVHSVIEYSANLKYERESGALNESFADIFGTVVEYYKDPTGFDWYMGEDASLNGTSGAFRSMSNPNLFGDPDTYDGYYWYGQENCVANPFSNDNCGVHTNSGVQNYWFYLLAQGGSGTNDHGESYSVSGIGIAKAADIAYNNLTNYLTINSDYIDAYNGSVQAASDLYGVNSNEVQQVKNAWCAVGLGVCGVTTNGQLTLTTPNGGESLSQGLPYNITWTSSGSVGNYVKLEYSINGGTNWQMIADSVGTTNASYNWTTPSNTTNIALVRITDLANNTIEDESDTYFNILPCSINAVFTSTTDTICPGSNVGFTNQSTGVIDSYLWSLDGVQQATTNNWTHTFNQEGSYTVELKVEQNGVCADFATKEIVVLPSTELNCISNVNCLTADSLALIALYNSTNGANWTNTWELSQPVSTWFGVTLSADGCSVVCLDLDGIDNCTWGGVVITGNNLVGTIPPELGNLSNLTDLWLRNNDLSGGIPIELGNLSNLVHLDLENNPLGGSIPSELGNLSNLILLNLVSNQLLGGIPANLGNLSNLTTLNLGANDLTGSIPSSLGNLSSLTSLNLSYNELSGLIPPSIGNLSNLNFLYLFGNQLTGPIPNDLGNLSSLNFVRLSNNQLVGCYPEAWCSLNFTYSDFSNNPDLPDGGSSQGFQDFCNLPSSCIYNCLESDSLALVSLYNATSGSNWFNTWDLSQPLSTWYGVTLSQDACKVIELKLDNNNLTGSLPADLGNLYHLTNLNLGFNQISGNIPIELGNLSSLNILAIHQNQLSGEIPPELGDLSNLTDLLLNDNLLSGNFLPALGKLSNLTYLYLSNNLLSGSLPPEIGNLFNLVHVQIGHNQLSGSLPSEIGNLVNLEVLTLPNNQLSGSLPAEMGNMASLRTLSLAQNQLSGGIPPELGDLPNLRILFCSNNQLSGNIPSELGNIPNLHTLWLHHNQLSGNIPPELGNLSSLVYLELNNNQLSGSIPGELGNLPNLRYFKLYDNELSGCYPQSLCNLNLNDYDFYGNIGLPSNGSIQGFQDFCNGIAPPCVDNSFDVFDVYPGDFNFDGIANYQDIVSFGLFFGELGYAREGTLQDINWTPHTSDNWGSSQESYIDVKHIDANGDGVIDLEDLNAIITNYDNTHNDSPNATATNFSTDSPLEIYLQPTAIPSFDGNDNLLHLDVVLEDALGDEISMYGGYFTIEYDHPYNLIESVEVIIDSSWLGVSGENLEYIAYNDTLNEEIQIGITRIDHSDGQGGGPIADVIVSIANDTPWDSTTFQFNVSDISVHNSEAVNLPTTANNMASLLTLYQNPCRDSLLIDNTSTLSLNHQAAEVISTSGNVVINLGEEVNFRANEGDINTGFEVKTGGEFAFYNDPCAATINLNKPSSDTPNKNYSWECTNEGIKIHYTLDQAQSVSIELLDENVELKRIDLGEQSVGKHTYIIDINEMSDLTKMACMKIGKQRHYFSLE